MSNEETLVEKAQRIKKFLKLQEYGIDIDDDLLLLAFVSRAGRKLLPIAFRKEINRKYQTDDYEWYEFIGDAVLELLITTIFTEIGSIGTHGMASVFRMKLVENKTLDCYMKCKDLCKESIGIVNDKTCADIFEAIIGVIYYHLYYIKGLGYESLNIMRRWLKDYWYIQESLDSLLQYGKTDCDTTPIPKPKPRGTQVKKTSSERQLLLSPEKTPTKLASPKITSRLK
jgi:dsRNA-specific ribonuclease